MEIIQTYNGISLKYVRNFDLSQTFDCGQCFRWEKFHDTYHGIVGNRTIKIYQKSNEILIENTTIDDFKNFWYYYFDLNTDYSKIKQEIIKFHPVLQKAYVNCSGIRILRQDPWESLCSFIISQNNNIPRIKKIISKLCSLFGDKLISGFTFPSAEKLSMLTLQELEPIKSGFRAKYILDAAQKVSSGEIDFENIQKSDFYSAKQSLMSIKGVGPKIAECVLLYGFHRLEAFPMDVWIKKIMNTFFEGKPPEIFGEFAGVVQQYLYHYVRMNPDILNKSAVL